MQRSVYTCYSQLIWYYIPTFSNQADPVSVVSNVTLATYAMMNPKTRPPHKPPAIAITGHPRAHKCKKVNKHPLKRHQKVSHPSVIANSVIVPVISPPSIATSATATLTVPKHKPTNAGQHEQHVWLRQPAFCPSCHTTDIRQ